MDKKYQIFISSTYKDLKEERKEVTRALLEMDCIPTGMEMFQASDESQWELIKRVISSCDYYVVIIAGRYGSVHPKTKKSYTQMEYEYASKIGIPIIGFLYEDINILPINKIDKDIKLQEKLSRFRKSIENKRIVKYWSNAYELSREVSISIFQMIKTHPRNGWVRYDENYNNQEQIYSSSINSVLLNKLNNLEETVKNKNLSFTYRYDINGIGKENVYNVSEIYKEMQYKDDTHKDEISYSGTLSLKNIHIDAIKEISHIILINGINYIADYFTSKIESSNPELVIINDVNTFNIINNNAYNFLFEVEGIIPITIITSFQKQITGIWSDLTKYTNVPLNDKIVLSALKELGSIFTGNCLTALSLILYNYRFNIVSILDNDIKQYLFNQKNIDKGTRYIIVKVPINMINKKYTYFLETYILFDIKYIKMVLNNFGFLDC